MIDCRYCRWLDPQLPPHCFKLGKLLDDDELLSDEPCEDFIDIHDRLNIGQLAAIIQSNSE